MNDEPKAISKEGEVAIKVVEERYRPLLEEAEGEVRGLLGEGRWEVVFESGIAGYDPSHRVSLSVKCCRGCCEGAPFEARHLLEVGIHADFLGGNHPLIRVSAGMNGFSYDGFEELRESLEGFDQSPWFALYDPRLMKEVRQRIEALQRVLRRADAMDEDRWDVRD